jgi:hypothetical protein
MPIPFVLSGRFALSQWLLELEGFRRREDHKEWAADGSEHVRRHFSPPTEQISCLMSYASNNYGMEREPLLEMLNLPADFEDLSFP